MSRVARVLEELQAERGLRVEDLDGDETFMTILVEASKAALGTHIEEKLALLAGCVKSAALPENRDDFIAMRYLRYVEDLSPEHFLVLTYLADPLKWYEKHGIDRPVVTGPRRYALDNARIGLPGEVLDIVLSDLGERGLADVAGLGGIVSENAVYGSLATPRGRELMRFVQAF